MRQVIAVVELLQWSKLEILDQEAGRDDTAPAQRSVHTPASETNVIMSVINNVSLTKEEGL